ncbi:Senescence domain-containing protein [Aphelenchoides bicaudatus]|nr:Senescence domain-containing protein [Aphelenchoides bicaudatus]
MSHQTMTVDSLLGECLAYVEQGIVCLEENDKENAATMLNMAEELIREAEKMDGAKRSDLYPMTVDGLHKLEAMYNNVESVELKKTTPLGTEPLSDKKKGHETLDAELIYWLPEGVQLVTIENEQSAVPSPPTSLAIFEVEQPKKSDKLYPDLKAVGNPTAIIQVGPWVYPLNKETTAIMKNAMGVYVVPNPTEEQPNLFVGIILPRGIEKHLESEFVQVLEKYATVRQSTIIEGGQKFAQGIQTVSDKTGAYMSEQGEKYRAGKVPTDKPVNINPALRYGVLTVYKGSKTFAKVTRYVLDKVGEVGVNIGNRLARGASGTSPGGRLIGSTATVLGGGIAGASVVWITLEDASKQLFRNLSDETVETVKLHYGEPASVTTRQFLHAGGHTTLSAFQLWDLGPRSIAGRVARKAGLQFVSGMASTSSSNNLSNGASAKELPEKKSKKM